MSQRGTARTVDVAVGFLLAVQLLTCFVAITMMSRLRVPLGTAVTTSMRESALVEQQLSRLARIARNPDPAIANEYVKAVEALQEYPGIDQNEARLVITQDATLALAGDAAAVDRSVRALQQVSTGARQKLHKAEQTLAFQSRAAAWVFVFLGGTVILLAGMARGWLSRSLVVPLAELTRVIEARAHGDARVRAAPLPQEEVLATSILAVNQLLDTMDELEAKERENAACRALQALLDSRSDAAVIVTERAQIVAMNKPALELLSSEAGAAYRVSLDNTREAMNRDPRLRVEVLNAEHRLICLRSCET